MVKKKTIGVLALQGCVDPHEPHILASDCFFKKVKTEKDFLECDAFILPGGESTTMIRNLDNFGLWDFAIQQFSTKPVWGICAGSILLAEEVLNPTQKSMKLLPITVERNAYGRQLESFQVEQAGYLVSFIRAPRIVKVSPQIEVLAQHLGEPTWVQIGKRMASTFHPELTHQYPSPMHRKLASLI